jgi:phosphate-selective porin OprO/OprP
MNLKKKIIPVLIAPLFVGLTLSGQALANDNDELEKLRQLVQELDQKVKILDRKGELAEEAAAAKKKETPVVKASQDGFGFESADGKNKIKFKALAQIDYRNYQDADPSADAKNIDGFTFRRIRPTIEGTLANKYDFRFTPEFGENKAAVVDAYIDARFQPWVKVRAGKFKPFVGLERLQSGSDIKFIERSYVSNNILPNRDLGVSFYGDLFDNKLNYSIGVFNGVVDGGENTTAQDTNGDKEYAVRLFTTPFKDNDNILAGLGFGLAATHGQFTGSSSNTGLPSYKSAGQQNNFFAYSTGVYGSGDRNRYAPQAYYYYGPFGVIAEYARVEQDVKNSSGNTESLKNDAWQIAGSWLITGEDASFRGVKPKNSFDADTGKWGAWEIVARYQENNIDEKAFIGNKFSNITTSAKSAQSWALGVNWYLNQNVKLATNYEQTSYKGGAAGSTLENLINLKDEKTLFTRLQISY